MHPTYAQLYELLVANGAPVESRMGRTREVVGGVVRYRAGEMISRRGLGDALGFMELLQVVAGVFDLDQIKRVAPKAQHELFTEQMAYGPRLAWQIPELLGKLRDDPLTRQAVAFIGQISDGPSPALPCTLAVQLLVRGGELNALYTMRSWDLSRGMPNDVVFQGGLVLLLARCLGLEPGLVTTMAGSLHLYEDQAEKTPLGTQRHFELTEDVPREWSLLQAWAREQIPVFTRVPAGITVVTNEPAGIVRLIHA